MRALVVLVAARSPVLSRVRDVLRDWVALDLVEPFVWVDAGELAVDTSLQAVMGTEVLADDARRVRLQDHLADQRSLDVVRLVAVGSADGESALVPPALAGRLNTALSAVAAGRVRSLQCILTRHGAGGWSPDAPVDGWRTCVLSPEDSWSPDPGQPSTEFATGDDDDEFVAHCAAGLASAAALWTGSGAGAFDDGYTSNPDPVVFRAFVRRLDASGVTARLRGRLFDLSGGLPLPRSAHGRLESVQDPQQSVRDQQQALVAKHDDLFTVPWVRGRGPESSGVIGVWAAVKMFFIFLLGAVRSAPAALVDRVTYRAATRLSAAVQSALFGGAESKYEVVTRGVNADGLPPGTRDLAVAADDVQERLSGTFPHETATPDLSAFWTDVAATGLALADGGDHGSTIGPVTVAGNARVVRNVEAIAPSFSAAHRLPSVLAARVGTPSVSPYDVRLQQQVSDALAHGVGSGDDVQAFGTWRERVQSSFTGLLGHRLAGEVDERAQAMAVLIERLRAPRAEVDEAELGRRMRKVRTVVLEWLLGVLLAIVLVVVGVRVLSLGLLAVLAIAVVLLVGWTIAQVVRVLAHQRHVFALLHARDRTDDELETASRNLPVAAAALRLSTVMYDQYLAWAPVLGRFLAEPFGPPVAAAVRPRLRGLLPRSVGVGVATTTDDQVAAVAHQLGGSIFERGWLQPLWEACLSAAPQALGPAGLPLRDDPQLLLRDPAGSPDCPLRRWSALVSENGLATGTGDVLWARAREALRQPGNDGLSEQLLGRVEVQAQEQHAVPPAITGGEFFDLVTDALRDVDRHYFAPQLFSDWARTQDLHRVVATTVLGVRDPSVAAAARSRVTWVEPDAGSADLDRFLVVVQTGAPVPPTELTLRGDETGGDPDGNRDGGRGDDPDGPGGLWHGLHQAEEVIS